MHELNKACCSFDIEKQGIMMTAHLLEHMLIIEKKEGYNKCCFSCFIVAIPEEMQDLCASIIILCPHLYVTTIPFIMHLL